MEQLCYSCIGHSSGHMQQGMGVDTRVRTHKHGEQTDKSLSKFIRSERTISIVSANFMLSMLCMRSCHLHCPLHSYSALTALVFLHLTLLSGQAGGTSSKSTVPTVQICIFGEGAAKFMHVALNSSIKRALLAEVRRRVCGPKFQICVIGESVAKFCGP